MTNTLKLVLSDHWFEEIKSGRKTHEYREAKPFWIKRLKGLVGLYKWIVVYGKKYECWNVEFQKAYRKNPERMTFKIKNVTLLECGKNTDLKCDDSVFDIELGERVK